MIGWGDNRLRSKTTLTTPSRCSYDPLTCYIPIYGYECLKLTHWATCWNLSDVTLADEDTNSILIVWLHNFTMTTKGCLACATAKQQTINIQEDFVAVPRCGSRVGFSRSEAGLAFSWDSLADSLINDNHHALYNLSHELIIRMVWGVPRSVWEKVWNCRKKCRCYINRRWFSKNRFSRARRKSGICAGINVKFFWRSSES